MKSALLFVVTLAVFILVGWMNARLWFVSDEQRIHRLIERGRLSLENGSILSFHTILSEAYQDRRGADRTIALQYLNQFFEETKNRKFQLHHLVIHLDGEQAEVDVNFSWMAESTEGGVRWLDQFGNRAGIQWRVQLRLQKEKKRWKIVYSDVQSVR